MDAFCIITQHLADITQYNNISHREDKAQPDQYLSGAVPLKLNTHTHTHTHTPTHTHTHTHQPLLPTILLCWEKRGCYTRKACGNACLLETTGALPALLSFNNQERTDGGPKETERPAGGRRACTPFIVWKDHIYIYIYIYTLMYNNCLPGCSQCDLLKWKEIYLFSVYKKKTIPGITWVHVCLFVCKKCFFMISLFLLCLDITIYANMQWCNALFLSKSLALIITVIRVRVRVSGSDCDCRSSGVVLGIHSGPYSLKRLDIKQLLKLAVISMIKWVYST